MLPFIDKRLTKRSRMVSDSECPAHPSALRAQAQSLIQSQLKRSQLWKVNKREYVDLLVHAANQMAVRDLMTLTAPAVQGYLRQVKRDLTADPSSQIASWQLEKMRYVLQLVLDDQRGIRSEPCPGLTILCPYCQCPAMLTDSKRVYGQSYGRIYLCRNYPECDAYVGVHRHDNWPLGRLANAELRQWKQAAHRRFDALWQRGGMTRREAYRWMQREMQLPAYRAHIGELDVAECQRLCQLCDDWRGDVVKPSPRPR